jgi:hypothetical protein
MKNNNSPHFSANEIIMFAIGTLLSLLGLHNLFFNSDYSAGSLILLAIGLLLIAGGFLFNLLMTGSVDKLESNICERLNEYGYKHEKQDGVLYVKRNDSSFRVYLWDTPNRNIKRLYFIYDFGDNNISKVSKEGWAVGVNKINYDNPHITFISLGDGFSCRYETAINNSKDFLEEFNTAYQAIGNAIEDYREIYPYLERDYPNTAPENKSSIGFK